MVGRRKIFGASLGVCLLLSGNWAAATEPRTLSDSELDAVTAGNPALLILGATFGIGLLSFYKSLADIARNADSYQTVNEEGEVVEGRMNADFYRDAFNVTLEGKGLSNAVPRGMPSFGDLVFSGIGRLIDPIDSLPPPHTPPENSISNNDCPGFCVYEF